jgi:hypothetical protein
MAGVPKEAQGPKTRTVLFGRHVEGKAPVQWPIAVFVNSGEAKRFANSLKLLASAGKLAEVRALDPRMPIADGATHVPAVKYSALTLPYAPEASIGEDDEFEVA